ncbi:hypothetical protein NUV89_15920 [Pseudomonas sp. 18.1.10]|uniref:SecDF P1 head subdomain-containing protein n=1 Tax=Pseudomonas sp. 18.1.10 TaxID=2969302 RepID=UPI0021505C3A|nr:hypothetical protein [Pseudomonas sp. 18.1.10]MCR4539886.1 hypothetical protein [Pseudomonas sp. 18.1.10]
MSVLIAFLAALLAPLVAWAEPPAKLFYNAQTDFVEMSLALKTAHNPNPQSVDVNVTLSPEAKARTAAVSTQAIGKPLALYLNGRLLTTATVHTPIVSGSLRFSIPKTMLPDLLPSLLR